MKQLFLSLLFFSFAQANETAYIFCHGIVDNGDQAKKYEGISLEKPYRTFDFPDACKRYVGDFWRLFKSSFGQESELQILKNEYDALCAHEPNKDIVGIGLSRGGSIWINFLSKYNLDKKPKALILESPYSSMENLIHHMVHRLLPLSYLSKNWQNRIEKIIHILLGLGFINYNRNGRQPIECIDDVPKDIPILLICSKEDTTVNWNSTKNLYDALVESGHQKVHLVVLDKGKHAKLIQAEDKAKYRAAIQTFQRKYGLPNLNANE